MPIFHCGWKDNTLIITANQTDHKFYSLPSVDGARFNGTYVMSEAYGKIPAITFTPDGNLLITGQSGFCAMNTMIASTRRLVPAPALMK